MISAWLRYEVKGKPTTNYMTPTRKGQILLLGMLLAFILAMCFGCNPARKIDKAEQLVITTPPSFQKVGALYWDLYRQPIDTTIIYKQGDSIPFPVLTIDSFATYLAVRELQDSMTEACKVAIDKAYRLGAEHAYKELSGKRTVRVDTILRNDPKCATILKMVDDSLTRANLHISRTEASLQSAVATGQEYRKDGRKWLWWFIGACVALGVTNVLWLYAKIKKP